jgi:hypothetical protein
MYSILNILIQAPVCGKEKKRCLWERITALSLLYNPLLASLSDISHHSRVCREKHPSQYLLLVEQMIKNDYPIPSYLTKVFKLPDGWIETLEAPTDTKSENQSVYAIDCEMVCALVVCLVLYYDKEKNVLSA